MDRCLFGRRGVIKVVLIGDYIRMGYQPFVAKKLPSVEVRGSRRIAGIAIGSWSIFKSGSGVSVLICYILTSVFMIAGLGKVHTLSCFLNIN